MRSLPFLSSNAHRSISGERHLFEKLAARGAAPAWPYTATVPIAASCELFNTREVAAPFKRDTSFGWLVNVVANSMGRELDARLKAEGLSLKVWPALMCLWEQEGVTQAELARMAQIHEYTTTRVLDRLEAAELIERRTDPRSRRSYTIHLTKAGRRLKKRLVPLAQTVNEQHLAPLKKAEADSLVRLLNKIVSTAERF